MAGRWVDGWWYPGWGHMYLCPSVEPMAWYTNPGYTVILAVRGLPGGAQHACCTGLSPSGHVEIYAR